MSDYVLIQCMNNDCNNTVKVELCYIDPDNFVPDYQCNKCQRIEWLEDQLKANIKRVERAEKINSARLIDELYTKIHGLENELSQYDMAHQNNEKYIKELEGKVDGLEQTIDDLEYNLKCTKEWSREKSDLIRSLFKQKREFQDQIDDKDKKLEDASNFCQKLVKDNFEAIAIMTSQESTIENLQRQIAELQQDNADAMNTILLMEDHQHQIDELQDNVESLQDLLKHWRNKYKKLAYGSNHEKI